jgi:hypothetical protein
MTNAETVNQTNAIINLTCSKHIKIFKLHKLGLTNKEVAESAGTNVGHVYNVLKDYEANPAKKEKADSVA